MPTVFVSYRRSDDPYAATLIYKDLAAKFGDENVYFDIDSVPLGIDFQDHIQQAVEKCDVLIAVIGEKWLEPNEDGDSRLDDPMDFVRIELETALKRNIPVIPVAVGDASLPDESELPKAIGHLVKRNGTEVRPGVAFGGNMARLISGIERVTSPDPKLRPQDPSRSTRVWAPVAAAVVGVIGIIAAWQYIPSAPTTSAPVRQSSSPPTIDFFFPELAHYKRVLESTGVTETFEDLSEMLAGVTQEWISSSQAAMQLRSALWVIATENIRGLAPQVQEILRIPDLDPLIRAAAEHALTATTAPEDAITAFSPEFNDRLRYRNTAPLIASIKALGRLKINEAVQLLHGELDAGDEIVRLAAATALARLGDSRAFGAFLTLMGSADSATRSNAAATLRQWTGQDFGFSAHHPTLDRMAAITRWRNWGASRQTWEPFESRSATRILAVRGAEFFELDQAGEVVHIEHADTAYNSISELTIQSDGNRLLTDFMGNRVAVLDEAWREVHSFATPFQPRGSHQLNDGGYLVFGMSRWAKFDSPIAEPTSIRLSGTNNVLSNYSNFTGSYRLGANRLLVTDNGGLIVEFSVEGEMLSVLNVANAPRSVQLIDDGNLLIADFSRAAILSRETGVIWEYPLDGIRSAHQFPSRSILLGHESGLTLIDEDMNELWNLDVPPRGGYGFYVRVE